MDLIMGLHDLLRLPIRILIPVMCNSTELGEPGAHDEKVHTTQIVVDWGDDKAISRPDGSSGEESRVLIKRKLISRSGQISESSADKSPFDGWGPEKYSFRTGRMIPSRLGECWKHRIDKFISGFAQSLVEETMWAH